MKIVIMKNVNHLLDQKLLNVFSNIGLFLNTLLLNISKIFPKLIYFYKLNLFSHSFCMKYDLQLTN